MTARAATGATPGGRRLRWRPPDGLSSTALWAFLAVAMPALVALLADMSTVDLTYHLRIGEQILTAGIPDRDGLTFTAAGLPWQDQQWGAQLVLAGTWRLAGWTGLVLLRASLVGLAFGAVALAIHRAGAAVRPAAIVALLSFAVAAPALGLRPQLFGVALFAVTLALLGERHRHPRLAWLVPILAIAWANAHGSFFLAPLAAGAAWLEDVVAGRAEARRTLALALAIGAATVLTPFGPFVYAYALGLSINPQVTERITEWQPTTLRTPGGIVFFASALAVAFLLIRRGSAVRWPRLAWLAGLFLLGAYAGRGVAWWAIGAAVAIAPLLPARERLSEPRLARRLNAIIAALIVLAGIVVLPVFRPSDAIAGPPGLLREAPRGVASALRDLVRPGDHVFNPQPWGSWLEWAVPDARTFVDSRIELFPVAVWDEYAAIVAGVGDWQAVLDRRDVRIVVTSREQGAAFPQRLRANGAWLEAHADDDGVIFVRQ